MSVIPKISYHNVPASPALERLIQSEASKLERFFERIVSCRVLVELTNSSQLRGSPYHVRIELGVPGEQLVVNHSADVRPAAPSADSERVEVRKAMEHEPEHKDPQLAVRDAFHKLERRLVDYARRKSGR